MIIDLLLFLLLSLGINTLFFSAAIKLKSDLFTDLTYSLSFIALSIAAILRYGESGMFGIIHGSLVILWALRLGSYLFFRILKIKVDHRFDDRRDSFVRFGAFWLLQSITVWIVMLPIIGIIRSAGTPPIWLTVLSWGLFLVGLVVETIADIQKYRFKSREQNADRWMSAGLWSWSRHPNYFGEILLWWALSIPGLTLFHGFEYLLYIGPVFISFLLIKVSGIPLLEKSWEKKWGQISEFREYRRSTPLLFPIPPGIRKKGRSDHQGKEEG